MSSTLAALLVVSGAAAAQVPQDAARAAERAAERSQRKVERSQRAVERSVERAQRSAERAAERAGERPPTDDEQLAIAALEGLMSQPPERALPLLKKVLSGGQSTVVKQRALFVLSQIDEPEAKDILAQTARSPDATLRGEAIRSIGIGGDRQSLDALKPIYDAGGADVKQDVLQAWLIAGHREAIYQAALDAKTEEEATSAIHLLGAMGAVEELRKLGDKPKAARGLLDAYAVSGDLASLRKIAEGTGAPALRAEAVQRIGILSSDAARTALREIYARSTDGEVREAALQGMLIARDEQGVLAAYQTAKTSDEKRSLLRMLSLIDGDAALEAIDAALQEKKP